jgi:hypothetical protein
MKAFLVLAIVTTLLVGCAEKSTTGDTSRACALGWRRNVFARIALSISTSFVNSVEDRRDPSPISVTLH